MPQRSSARSIRASWTTGYWGAGARSGRRSGRVVDDGRDEPAGERRVAGSASVSARCRSRMAVAVRWPNSASKTAARASRRPARAVRATSDRPAGLVGHPQAPTPSTTITISPTSRSSEPLDGRRDGVADLAGERDRAAGPAGRRSRSRTSTRRPSSRGRPTGRRARIASQRGPRRPTRTTPGTSRAARRTARSTTSRATLEVGRSRHRSASISLGRLGLVATGRLSDRRAGSGGGRAASASRVGSPRNASAMSVGDPRPRRRRPRRRRA